MLINSIDKNKFTSPVILLRKKLEGENSIEEVASKIAKKTGAKIVVLPNDSISIKGILANIRFAKKIQSPVFHVIVPTESYLLPFLKGKKIVTFHDLQTILISKNFLYKLLKIFLYIIPAKYFADKITFVSKQTKVEFQNILHLNDCNKLCVIYNPVDDRLIPKASLPNKVFTILHIGTAPRKNLSAVIEACNNLDVKLDIIGKLSKEQFSLLLKNQINYENCFDITFEDIVNHYSSCDIVSFPSSYEGFGIPLIEANSMGKPVIAGDIAVLKEIGFNAAFFVEPGNISQIRNAINLLKNDKTKYDNLVIMGKRNAIQFSMETIGEQYKNIYREVLK